MHGIGLIPTVRGEEALVDYAFGDAANHACPGAALQPDVVREAGNAPDLASAGKWWNPYKMMPATMVESTLQRVLTRLDAANAEDPRLESHDGVMTPREVRFARRVDEWVVRLVPAATDELRIAARGHTLRRWMIPREQYPKTKVGYRAWRAALNGFHAEQTDAILAELGIADSVRARVRDLITKKDWRNDPEGRALEDGDCLAFLELKLAAYLDEWGDAKTIDILKKTLRKMTPQAIALAGELALDPRTRALLHQAVAGPTTSP